VPKELQKTIANNLILKNPSYEQAIRTNPRARYALSEYIKYYDYNKKTDTWTVGRGVEDSIRKYCDRNGIRINCRDLRKESRAEVNTSIRLRDYQTGVPEEVVSASKLLTGASGIVRLDTGFGKTLIALKIIELLKQKTLIIVPKIDLLNQFVYEIKKWTNINPGIIQGKNMVVKEITVATIQSLTNKINRRELDGEGFGAIIVDEAHQFITSKRSKAIEYFSARFRYGLTATARRSDGQGRALNWLFGPVLTDHGLPRATPSVCILPFTGKIRMGEYHDIIEEQTTNKERNGEIARIAKEQIQSGRKILILTKRVSHYEELKQLLGESDESIIAFSSGQKKEERDALLLGLRDGSKNFSVILGTFNLLSTGIDIPILDTLIIAGDLKSNVLAEQSAGRVLRLFEGKDDPLIIDIHDTGNPILRNQGKLRQKFYRENGWEIVDSHKPL